MESPEETGECSLVLNEETNASDDVESQNASNEIENQNDIEDADCEIIGFKSKSIPLIDIIDEGEKKNKKETKSLKKIDDIISHVGHNIIISKRKFLCVDCGTRLCPICYENLATHLKHHIFHTNLGSYPCSVCDVTFRTNCALKAHENLHKDIFPLVCPDCGAIYQQTKHFINHSLNRCSHLFKQARYLCCACDATFESKLEHENHIKEHVYTKYHCRLCRRDLGTSKKEALIHFLDKHNIRLSPRAATFGLDVNTYCNICLKFKPHDHYKAHLSVDAKTILICSCGLSCAPHIFRTHRKSCASGKLLPRYWRNNLPKFDNLKNNEENCNKNCVKCGCFTGTFNYCEFCSTNKREFKKCRHCSKSKRVDEITNLCWKCSAALNKSVCTICASLFEFKENQAICDACMEKHEVESAWLGGELIVGNEVDSFETCELVYENHPPDHQYCLRQEFVSKIENQKSQKSDNKLGIIDSAATFNGDRYKMNSSGSDSSIRCNLCKEELNLQGNFLYKLFLHVKRHHANAVLPIPVPQNFKHIETEELDLMSRIKKLQERNQTLREAMRAKEEKADKITTKKRLRLYDPKTFKKAKTVSEHEPKVEEHKENHSENLPTKEIQTTPPKKDHEFWDEVYEALSVVDKRNVPKSKKAVVYENLSGYSSKRQVKKPKRLVEQEDNQQQSLSRKVKIDNDNGLLTPEKIIIKESSKKENSSTDESEELLNGKLKKKIAHDLARVAYQFKNDNELGFLAKTFKVNENEIPNKRKRKLASKLVFNQTFDDVDEYVCDLCNILILNRGEFKQHLMTHQVEGSTHPCMECGKNLSSLSALKNHLRVGHQIIDADTHVGENGYRSNMDGNGKEEEAGMSNGIEHKCKVCYQGFPSVLELSKHFRVHGLAFLKEAQKDSKLT